jgi:hypothetical protein
MAELKTQLQVKTGADQERLNLQGAVMTGKSDYGTADQVQDKLLTAKRRIKELKHQVKHYDQFFIELYEFLATSHGDDLVPAGLSKLRRFYRQKHKQLVATEARADDALFKRTDQFPRKFNGTTRSEPEIELVGLGKKLLAYTTKPSLPGTPKSKNLEVRAKHKLTKAKTDRKHPSVKGKTPRNSSKINRMMSPPQARSGKASSMRSATSSANSRSSTPHDKRESVADQLQLIKLKTLAVLQAWESAPKDR